MADHDQVDEKGSVDLSHVGSHDPEKLHKTLTYVEGTTQLYENGRLRYIPYPTADPNDPLNLPRWRKLLAISACCFFGSMSLGIQQSIAGMLPVFAFVYSDVGNYKILNSGGTPPGLFVDSHGNPNPNALGALAHLPGVPPLWRLNLLVCLPVLLVGISNYLWVPLSVLMGRRTIFILSGILAWVGPIWAGKSTSLESHIAARCIQSLGAGTVESLIPYVVSDMTFIHERSTAIGAVWASQGIVSLAFGIGGNYIVSRLSWQWLYYVFAIITAAAWLVIVIAVPETRWRRSKEEMRGEKPVGIDLDRPEIDYDTHGKRSWASDFGLFYGGFHVPEAVESVKEIVESLFFPNVIYIILLNSVFIGVSLASNTVLSPVLLAPPYSWKFEYVGYVVVPIFIATFFVMLFGGIGADWTSNWLTKRRGGIREPEVHLYNLIFPVFCGVLGCILFGVGGQYSRHVHWVCILFGEAFLFFGFLTCNIVGSVYSVEAYPMWAGPVLVNVASFRNIIGFGFTYGVVDWTVARGYMGCFGIFAGCLAFLSLGIPVLLVYGKKWRKVTGKLTRKTTHSD